MKEAKEKEDVTRGSVVASAVLVVLKLAVGVITGSIAIISEAAHSSIDLVATILTFFAVRIGGKPADKRHHFGHGKIESVTALIETGLLMATSFLVVYEAVRKIITGSHIFEITWYSFAVMALSIIIDFLRSRALGRVAKETGSQAMQADALNFQSDMYSSLVVIIGLILARFGWPIADALASIAVSIMIAIAAWRLARQTIDVLIDAAPEGVEEEIIKIVKTVPEVIDIQKIRVRPAGNLVFVDMTIHVSRRYTLDQIQQIKEKVSQEISEQIPEIDLNLSAVPLTMSDETTIEQIRLAGQNHSLAVHDISIHHHGEKRFISFDVEIEAKTSLGKAYRKVRQLESHLCQEIGGETEIVIHMEPQYDERKIVEEPSQKEIDLLKKAIEKAAAGVKELSNIHQIEATKHQGKLHVTLHCYAEAELPLERVHWATSKLDKLARQNCQLIKRVTIHTEPKP